MTAAETLLDPFAEASRIGPTLRRHAAQADRDARLPTESVEALRDAGFFRLYVPRSLGGAEVDPLTYACAQEELARHDPAAAWGLQAAGSSAWWCSRLPDETVAEIYADGPDQLLAVSFPVPIDAVRVDGGFRLSGRREFASNVSDASWIWVTAASQDETVDDAPVTRAAFFPASDARIVHTWDILGMRGTDSNDVELDGLLVPERRTFRIGIDHEPGPRFDRPLYRAAAMVLVASYVPAVALGIAREALAELVALAQDKTPFASTTSLRNRNAVQSKLGRGRRRPPLGADLPSRPDRPRLGPSRRRGRAHPRGKGRRSPRRRAGNRRERPGRRGRVLGRGNDRHQTGLPARAAPPRHLRPETAGIRLRKPLRDRRPSPARPDPDLGFIAL